MPSFRKPVLRNPICHKHCEQTLQQGEHSEKQSTRKKILRGKNAHLPAEECPSHPSVQRSIATPDTKQKQALIPHAGLS